MTTKKETKEPKKKPTAKKTAKPAAKKTVKPAAKVHHEEKETVAAAASGAYFFAVGRRKSGIASVRLYPSGSGAFTVNDKPLKTYLPLEELQDTAKFPLKAVGMDATADVVAHARGGGIRGQADALRLGVARALLKINPDFRATLKPLGVMTRDPREKERKKYGLKKARKAPQWAKR